MSCALLICQNGENQIKKTSDYACKIKESGVVPFVLNARRSGNEENENNHKDIIYDVLPNAMLVDTIGDFEQIHVLGDKETSIFLRIR